MVIKTPVDGALRLSVLLLIDICCCCDNCSYHVCDVSPGVTPASLCLLSVPLPSLALFLCDWDKYQREQIGRED